MQRGERGVSSKDTALEKEKRDKAEIPDNQTTNLGDGQDQLRTKDSSAVAETNVGRGLGMNGGMCIGIFIPEVPWLIETERDRGEKRKGVGVGGILRE